MAILKKTLFDESLETVNVLVNDTDPNSRYFKITELPDTFTGGKNAFLIQGSPELVSDTIVKIQIRDSQGKIIYHEPGEGIPEYFEGTSKVVAVYIYPDTAFGPCTVTILGELSEYVSNGVRVPVPENWKDTYNVKWEKQINVNPILANTSKIRFYRRPKIDITESILPIYNRNVSRVTISGSINGTAIVPAESEDYRTFKGVSRYELSLNGLSQFSESMERETIEINGLAKSYSPIITDVTTNKKAFVDIPYYSASFTSPNYYEVLSFQSASFTMSYDESVTLTNSSINSSFATINITDLDTFSGDVNRIKVYASSKNDLGDLQLLEDVQLESNELLLTSSFANQLNVRTGLFTDSIVSSFWTSSAIETTANLSVDNVILLKSAILSPQTDYSSSVGLFKFYNKDLINFTKNTEYQLDFTPLLSTAVDTFGGIEVYMSGSAFTPTSLQTNYGKKIGELITNTQFRKYDKQQINFKPDADGVGNLVYVVKSGTWHISDISLRAAQESSFSPNEITLTVNVPVKINNEAFDFKFELYDINNNYVPVLLEKEFTFTGGNDVSVRRDLQLNVSNNSFNFSTASAFPQFITIDFTSTGLTGSVEFKSQSVDVNGNLITATPQPGTLEYVDVDTRTLSLANFIGSSSLGVTVGAITYTASCEDVNRYFTIFRIDQGAPARLFYATADKNNFVFDPDDRYKSDITDDFIDIRLVRQNLPAFENEGFNITSGSEVGTPPPLHEIESVGNATVYRLFVTSSTHPYSTTPISGSGYVYDFGQSHYDFKYYTVDGDFTSSVTIDAVLKGDKGKGLIATSDANQFFYKMTDLSPLPVSQTITVLVKRLNLGSLTNTITVTSGSAPALSAPTYEGNGVTSYTISAGQSTNYRFNTGVQTYTFTAYDLNGTAYTDEVTISPVIAESQISVNLTNENATLPARSTGFVASGSFVATSGSVSVKVGGEDITREEGLSTNNRFDVISVTGTNCTPNGGQGSNPSDATYGITSLTADSGSLSLVVRYKDGRDSTTDITKVVTYSKAKAAAPLLSLSTTNKAQSVSAKSTGEQIDFFANAVVTIAETYNGSTSPLTLTLLSGSSSDLVNIVTNNSTGLVTLTGRTLADGTNAASVAITASVTDSEGQSRTLSDTISLTKVKKAAPSVLLTANPQNQTIPATSQSVQIGNLSNVTLDALEGTSSVFNSASILSSNFTGASITGTSKTFVIGSIANGVPAASASIGINYTDSEGTKGNSVISVFAVKSLAGNTGASGSNGAPGATGPGITYVGECSGLNNSFVWTNDSIARNVTSTTGTYYITKPAAHGLAKSVTGCPPNTTYFEEMQDFDSVATDIFLAQDATITRGLVMGTFGGNNGFIRSANASSLNSGHGYYLDRDGNLRVGTDTTGSNWLRFESGALTVNGTINVTGGNAATQTYANTIGTNAVASGSAAASAAQQAATLAGQTAATNAAASASAAQLFAQTAAANAVTSGSNAASTAQTNAISTANANALAFASASVNLLANGGWVGGSGTFITSTSISSPIIAGNAGYISSIFKVGENGITLDGGNKKIFVGTGTYNNSNTPFYFASGSTNVFSLGDKLHFNGSDLTVSGSINATAGNFSGNITSTATITGGTISGGTISGGTISIGTGNNIFKADSNGIYLGNTTFASAPFRVTPAGALTATNVTISGGAITIGSNFSVDTSGNMVANNASMTGIVTANTGRIGGWNISGTALEGSGSAGKIILDPSIPSMRFNNATGATKLTIRTGQLTYLGGNSVNLSMPSQTTGAGTYFSNVYNETVGVVQSIYIPNAGSYVGVPAFTGNGSNLYYTSPTFNGFFSVNFWIDIMDGPTYATANNVGYISVGGDTTYGMPNETGVMNIYPYLTTLSFPTAGNYYLFPVRAITGNFTSGYVQLAGGGYGGASSDFNPEVDFGELTEFGLQVASSVNQYAKIARNSSYAFESEGAIYVKSPNANTFSYFDGVVHPFVGNTNDLGTSGNRWRYIYSNNILQVSDRRLKEDIQPTDLGLDFINKLNPVKYKRIGASSPRFHYGLIAQEVTASLVDYGLTTSDAGFLVSSSVNYTAEEIEKFKDRRDWEVYEREMAASDRQELGIAYNELISPMIKSIQQLSAKIDELEAKISGSI